jgi:AAA domain
MPVVGLAFTGKAAGEIEAASQIPSRTLASLVNSQDNLHGKLVVVDEASMLSIRDMNNLLKRCDDDSKLVFDLLHNYLLRIIHMDLRLNYSKNMSIPKTYYSNNLTMPPSFLSSSF